MNPDKSDALRFQNSLRTNFRPRDYLKTYYPEEVKIDGEVFRKIVEEFRQSNRIQIADVLLREPNIGAETAENFALLDFLRLTVQRLLEKFPKGKLNVLDVGGGPTIYQHIAISLQAGRITHMDLLEGNLKEVREWVAGEEGGYNWDSYFRFMQNLLANDECLQETLKDNRDGNDAEAQQNAEAINRVLSDPSIDSIKEQVRSKLKGNVVPGNILDPDLGLPENFGNVDVVSCFFATEELSTEKTGWKKGMNHILSKIKPGGYLVLAAIKNATWYACGDQRLPCSSVSEDDLRSICAENGFDIETFQVLEGSDREASGYEGMIFLMARRIISP